MKFKNDSRFWVGIMLSLVMLVFFVLLVFSMVRLFEAGKAMRLEAPHNMLWVTSQAHTAGLKLALALEKHEREGNNLAALKQAHKVWLSRLALFKDGPQERALHAMGFKHTLLVIEQTLPLSSRYMDEVLQSNNANLPWLREWIEKNNQLFSNMSTESMVYEWEKLGGKLDLEREGLWTVTVSLSVILVAGAIVAFYLALVLWESRRRAEQLSREKAFSELMLNSSGESIVAIDTAKTCNVWNQVTERFFSVVAPEALGKPIHLASPFYQQAQVASAINSALAGNTVLLKELSFKHHFYELRYFPLKQDGRIVGALLLTFDVTELRLAEREIAQHRDHLEELVEERTKALDAVLERERLSSELSRNFGAMLSHQFRTPLAVVDSSLQRLIRRKDKLTPAEVEERGMRARRAIKRLIALITSTLDAARLDAGQVEARRQAINLAQLVKRVVEAEQTELAGRNITFNIQGEPSEVLCDATHVEHIVANLLSNAVKYSPPYSPIDISLIYGEQNVECRVCNQGELTANPESIFNRYYRGDNLAGTFGVGLGLYMAKMLAQLQGGNVLLGDYGDESICFVCTLPTKKSLGLLTDPRDE